MFITIVGGNLLLAKNIVRPTFTEGATWQWVQSTVLPP